MKSSSLGSHSGRIPKTQRNTPSSENVVEIVDDSTINRWTCKSYTRILVIILYFSITILDLVRGIIHTFLYETGLEDISGLKTGNSITDGRLAALMIAYGGSNIESFLVRSYILYTYAFCKSGCEFVRVSSVASALFFPLTAVVSSFGNIDVGDAELPGRYAMLIRSILSFVTLLLTYCR